MGKIPHLSLVASPLVTHGEFYFSPFVASPLMGKNPIPSPYPSFNSSMTSFMDEPSSWWPIKAERPETVQALAMAKPPPRSRTNDHGIFLWMTCQFKRAGEGCDEVTAI